MTQPQQTEADCLLDKGALYSKRLGLRKEDHDLIFAGFKQGTFSLYFGDAPIFHFDLEGRWQRAFLDNKHFLKRFDASVQEIDRVRDGSNMVLKRRTLDHAETERLDAEIRAVATNLLADFDANAFLLEKPPHGKTQAIGDAELRDFLNRIAAWDAKAWREFQSRHQATYGPLPFSPPDCQNALVVQATRGNAGGRSFGGGAVHAHSVRSVADFDHHVHDVAALLGRRLLQTKAVFLTGADVLKQPGADVLGYLEVIGRVLPLSIREPSAVPKETDETHLIDDVHVFLDEFQAPVADAETLKAAYDLRLSRIAFGVESGDPEVRRIHGKTWTDQELQSFVANAKEAGIGLSVLTLVGAGGRENREDHVAKTASLITSLALTRGDFVFLLDETEIAAPDSTQAGVTPLDEADRADQLALLRQALSPLRERGVKVLPYSMAKQWA